jgi:hypothetical protein
LFLSVPFKDKVALVTNATPATAITHIALQEKLDGKVVDWMEHVTGAQYRK